MRQIRFGVFETNSSSSHSLVLFSNKEAYTDHLKHSLKLDGLTDEFNRHSFDSGINWTEDKEVPQDIELKIEYLFAYCLKNWDLFSAFKKAIKFIEEKSTWRCNKQIKIKIPKELEEVEDELAFNDCVEEHGFEYSFDPESWHYLDAMILNNPDYMPSEVIVNLITQTNLAFIDATRLDPNKIPGLVEVLDSMSESVPEVNPFERK